MTPQNTSTRRAVVQGVGSALPRRRVDNAELAEQVDTTDEWIVERTGIRSRYIAADGETTATLAAEACRKALAEAGMEAGEIDLIVLATATPDQTFPSSATRVQAMLGIDDCIAFDVHAVCTGFLYALTVADSMLRGGNAKRALVIGSETFSRILDWEDRTTCVLFGDGAGAVVLEARDVAEDGPGILSTKLHADGAHCDLLYVDGGPSTTGEVGKLRMKGREVLDKLCFPRAVAPWGRLRFILAETVIDERVGENAIHRQEWIAARPADGCRSGPPWP